MKPRHSTARLAFPLASAIAALLAAQSAQALTYYWDQNDIALGFGTAGGTWNTTGSSTWNATAAGDVGPIVSTTTAGGVSGDLVNFGTGTAGGGLAAGTINVDGTVAVRGITFGSLSGAITLSGGTIAFGGVNNANGLGSNNTGFVNTISSKLTATSAAIIGSVGTAQLVLSGDNTGFLGQLGVFTRLTFSDIKNLGGGADSSLASGVFTIGGSSGTGVLEFAGASAAATFSRAILIGGSGTNTIAGSILNNNANPSHTLTFSASAFNTATGNAARTITLGGSNTGANSISGAIVNNTAALSLAKSGIGSWTLGGNNLHTGSTTLNAGTLKLNYDTGTGGTNSSKLSDTATTGTLLLNGGTLELSGGSHLETVLSTTLNTGGTFIKQTNSGTSTLSMGAIIFNGGAIDFSASSIATTSNTVTNGILSQRATVAGANFAMESVSNIVAYDYVISGSTDYTGGAMDADTNYAIQTAGGANTLDAGIIGATSNTLKIANTAAGSLAVDANTLVVGAMLFSGSANYDITTSGGNITSSILHNYGTGGAVLNLGALGGTLTQFGTGTTVLNNAATTNSTLTINGGTVQVSNNLQIGINSGPVAITLNNGTLLASETLALNNAGLNSRTFTLGAGGGTLAATNIKTLTVSGVISGTGNPLTVGSGSSDGTVTLSAVNTYTGGTRIDAGTLALGHATNTLVNTGAVAVNGGTLSIGGNSDTVGAVTLISGSITGSGGTLTGASYDVRSGSASAILGGTNVALTKSTNGTVTLSGTNSYTGATTVSAGILSLGSTGSVASSTSVAIAAGASLDTSGQAIYAIPTGKPLAFGIDATGSGSSGKITAAQLDITNATVSYNINGTPDDPAYVLATYTTLTGGTFLSAPTPPAGYTLNYAYEGNKIALVSATTPYDTWAAGPFTNLFSNTLPGVDFDNDGLSNLMEFVLGGDPTISQAGIAPAVTTSGGNLVMTFKRSDASELAPAVSVKVELSTDLSFSTPADDITIGPVTDAGPIAPSNASYTVTNSGGFDTIVLTLPQGAAPKKFARVKAVQP